VAVTAEMDRIAERQRGVIDAFKDQRIASKLAPTGRTSLLKMQARASKIKAVLWD